MLSYTGQRNLFGSLVNDSEAGVLTIADDLIDIQTRRLIGKRNWSFLERDKDITLVAGQQFNQLAVNVKKVKAAYVTIGTTQYPIKEAPSREAWNRLNQSVYTSDIPEYFFATQGKIGLWPKPASNGNVLTVSCHLSHKRLSIADYTTGGILTLAAGGTAVTGTTTSWATSMAGRFLCITESDTANKGDGEEYEISSVASTTALTLVKPYSGTAISSGNAAYTIGQCSIIPPDYRDVPVIGAVIMYYMTIKPETDLAQGFKDLYLDRFNEMVADYGQKSTSPVLNEEDIDIEDPNLFKRY